MHQFKIRHTSLKSKLLLRPVDLEEFVMECPAFLVERFQPSMQHLKHARYADLLYSIGQGPRRVDMGDGR